MMYTVAIYTVHPTEGTLSEDKWPEDAEDFTVTAPDACSAGVCSLAAAAVEGVQRGVVSPGDPLHALVYDEVGSHQVVSATVPEGKELEELLLQVALAESRSSSPKESLAVVVEK